MIWNIKEDKVVENVENLRKVLLKNRGIDDSNIFFHPKDPFELSLIDLGFSKEQLKIALQTLSTAVDSDQTILVYGDYDADGICATAIVMEALQSIGIDAEYFIPDRNRHGYGVTVSALQEIFLENKPNLMITVDNGIVAHEAIEYAESCGVKVILTDHHLPMTNNDVAQYPHATAVFHSTQLCGATVAWIFMREFLITRLEDADLKKVLSKSLDLCGIATIADLVPLLDANRSFAKYGIEQLAQNQRRGLHSLFALTDIESKQITAGTVGYRIAPMINAMGRITHGGKALELLLTKDQEEAEQLAQTLAATNKERQDITVSLFAAARKVALTQENEKIIVVASEDFHEGVIGLIAGRLVEEFSKPAIALSISATEMKASVRSIPGVHIIEFLEVIRPLTLSLGGHPMAGGFSIAVDDFEAVERRLFASAAESIASELLQKQCRADCVIDPSLVTVETVEALDDFAPFGKSNSRATVVVEQLVVQKIMRMGSEKQHLRLVLAHPDIPAEYVTVLCWRRAAEFTSITLGNKVSVLGRLELNHWKGRTSVQLVADDIKKVVSKKLDLVGEN